MRATAGATRPRPTSASSLAAIADRLPFVQLELAGSAGLDEGRYLARTGAGEPERVLVVAVAGLPAPARRRIGRPRPRRVEPGGGPATVPLTTITVIGSEPLGGAGAAREWLEALRADADLLEREVRDAVALVNRAVHAHRAAALDPAAPDVSAAHALAVRIGFGSGEQLAEGSYADAIELPPPAHRRRAESLRPQERVAEALSGEPVPPHELLLLRARADLDAGRGREAALQLAAGLEALVAGRDSIAGSGQEDDLAALAERLPAVLEAARRALAAEPGAPEVERLAETQAICERVLRRARLT